MSTDNNMAKIYDLPKTIYLPEDIEITGELVDKLIENHVTNNVPRYEQLQRYYEGWAAILNRKGKPHKANNKLVSAYPSYIVDMLLGMFMGNPVTYTVADDNQEVMDELQEVFDLNDEQDENTELAKMAGIKGRSYELVYIDEEGRERFDELEPDNVIYVYDDKISPEPLFAIYFYQAIDIDNMFSEDKDINALVYTRNEIIKFVSGENGLQEEYRTNHIFNGVPMIEFLNNDEGIGDFERVLSDIDAYNKSRSDTANDFEEFTEALLLLYGMLNADSKDVKQMMDDGVLLFEIADGDQDAKWLIKEINDVALENHNTRLDNDIHKFSMVPNLGDEQFAGNVSGESMKYKLLGLSQRVTSKQRKFKTALQHRLKLILDIFSIKNKINDEDFSYRDIEIVFNDNKPINEKENVDMVNTLMGIVSKQTALSRLYGLEDVNDELERIEQEKDPYMNVDPFIAYDLEDDEMDIYDDEETEEDDIDEEAG